MIRRRNVSVFLLACGLMAFGSMSAQQKATSRTGWISDEACGALHTKPRGRRLRVKNVGVVALRWVTRNGNRNGQCS